MKPRARWLKSRCQVLAEARTAGGRLGEGRVTWQPQGEPLKCANFPAGEKALRVAGLEGVEVTREIYLPQVNLSPTSNRLEVDGTTYAVQTVQEWDGLTVALCKEV